MKNTKIVDHLVSLAHLDIDAIHAYVQAIERVDVLSIKDQLSEFRADHQRHVNNISDCIRKLGGEPPEFARDFKGFLIEGMTALRSVTGTEGALKAMKMNEQLTNKTYEKALAWDLPHDVRQIVMQNRDDESRHLAYITEALEGRIWEEGDQVA